MLEFRACEGMPAAAEYGKYGMSLMQNTNEQGLSSLRLSANSDVLRDRPRPAALRQDDYDTVFDFRTVFYDVFYLGDQKTVRLIGPPFMNFSDYISAQGFTCDKGRKPVRADSYRRDVVSYIDLEFEEPAHGLTLDAGDMGCFQLAIRQNNIDFFADERVLLTMIKYDPLIWVQDWAEFYVRNHGATAVIIYNNQAPGYCKAEIEHALSNVVGLKKFAVVDWAFPYGPPGGASGLWDSAFCQAGALEHARWFYLQKARSVLNHDIDELVVCEKNKSIFDLLEQSTTGHLWYSSVWTSRPKPDLQEPAILERRHKDYGYYGNLFFSRQQPWDRLGGAKWGVVPEKCSLEAQWQTHKIEGMQCDQEASAPVFFRHFRDMNTQWKAKRDAPMKAYHRDEDLLSAYRKIGWA